MLSLLSINGNNTNVFPQVSYSVVGWTHLALRSKSVKKRLEDKIGQACKCDACNRMSVYFVCILATLKPATYYTVCDNCYTEDTWQEKIVRKEITTSVGSSSGSQNSASKPRGNHSQGRWEESIAETLSGNSEDTDWWLK